MTASDNRLAPSALIPWVFVLVALIGCNITPNPVSVRKGKYLEGSSLSQVASQALPSGAISTPPVFMIASPCAWIRLDGPSSLRLGIETAGAEAFAGVWSGAVRGRAPPVGIIC